MKTPSPKVFETPGASNQFQKKKKKKKKKKFYIIKKGDYFKDRLALESLKKKKRDFQAQLKTIWFERTGDVFQHKLIIDKGAQFESNQDLIHLLKKDNKRDSESLSSIYQKMEKIFE